MPIPFESFGIKFLYPDNWTVVDREDGEGSDGVTLELPSGGFFTIERVREGQLTEELIEDIANAMAEEYDDVEREDVPVENGATEERTVDFRFYYLDLLIVSRLMVVRAGNATFVIQMQAESRDFDANELVFSALLKQIRG